MNHLALFCLKMDKNFTLSTKKTHEQNFLAKTKTNRNHIHIHAHTKNKSIGKYNQKGVEKSQVGMDGRDMCEGDVDNYAFFLYTTRIYPQLFDQCQMVSRSQNKDSMVINYPPLLTNIEWLLETRIKGCFEGGSRNS